MKKLTAAVDVKSVSLVTNLNVEGCVTLLYTVLSLAEEKETNLRPSNE
jgi:hypothetical protein